MKEYFRVKDKFFPGIGATGTYYTTAETDLLSENGQEKYLKALNLYSGVEKCEFCEK